MVETISETERVEAQSNGMFDWNFPSIIIKSRHRSGPAQLDGLLQEVSVFLPVDSESSQSFRLSLGEELH